MKGAIFDMDGTLVDSMPLWDSAGTRYLKQTGIQPPPDLREKVVSLSMALTVEYMKELGVPYSSEEIYRQVNEMMAEEYRLRVPEKAGSIAFLRRLKADGVRLCLLTATDRPLVELALARLGMSGYFSFILTCTEAGLHKSDPALFELALDKLGCDRAEVVVFEDALYAIRTAKEMGLRVVAVEDALSQPDQAEIRRLADQYITHFSECEVAKL